jgi:hypothetical protein
VALLVAGDGSVFAAESGVDDNLAGNAPYTDAVMSEPEQPADGDANGPAAPVEAKLSTVSKAMADLAERLAIAREEITVVSVEEVTWPNGAVGCPQPGFTYPQVLVSGQRIILEVAGEKYQYNAGTAGEPRYCENPAPAVGER